MSTFKLKRHISVSLLILTIFFLKNISHAIEIERFSFFSPREIVEKKAEIIKKILSDNQERTLSLKKVLISEVLADVIDYKSMAIASLGNKAKGKSSEEKEKFAILFFKYFIFKNNFLGQVASSKTGEIEVLKESVDSGQVLVEAKLSNESFRSIQVCFKFRNDKERKWKIYDIQVEGTSCVSAYRNDFDSFSNLETLSSFIQTEVDRYEQMVNSKSELF